MTAYAELDARTNFCFLEGASHPRELVIQAQVLGLAALGVADRNSLAGVVRAHGEAKRRGFRFLPGCRLQFTDGAELIVYPRDRAAYGRLCQLLSIGKSQISAREDSLLDPLADASPDDPEAEAKPIPKGECRLTFEQAAEYGEGLIGLAVAPEVPDAAFEARLAAWAEAWPDQLYLAVAPLQRGDDRARFNRLAAIGKRASAPMIATGLVLYHHPSRRRLQDVLTCIREGGAIDEAGRRLQANAERFLKTPDEMARLFQGHEEALARTLEVAEACTFSLDDLKYEYPDEPVPPGKTPQQHLEDLVADGVRQKWPGGPSRKIAATITKELRLIAKVKYAEYFLTVHDIVAWARRQPDPILCQGRGSAANSVVCYCLGITSVDPEAQDVLFERFISEERSEPPDIDVDFEHQRREEVIQYVYDRYGRHRAAICATVISYRKRSAIRDVGKVLGLTEDVTSALANTVWGSWGDGLEDHQIEAAGLKVGDGRLKLALELTRELMGFPRHLSQHVGGFVLTQRPLVETVPIGNAAMEKRTFIEWDKDDIDELGIMKVDVLALGMLTAIKRAFDMIELHFGGERLELDTVPPEDPGVYDMLCAADSIGVFQVESRAQMAMLPRLRPREFYDLVVEVAIVRPGPIQGGMVHPYLRNREAARQALARGKEFEVKFPQPSPEHGPENELHLVLGKTLGVPLFQEQAMRIAMEAAKFTGDEANGLRRAMATFRHMGTIHEYEDKLVQGMTRRGYPEDFAKACFNQIKGFGEYGFPESHAAAFSRLVYVSAWLKWRHPEVFAAALLNSQPMGFYSSAQIVRDAREHGVEVRAPDVNFSDWDSTLEQKTEDRRGEGRGLNGVHPPARAMRLGLRQIEGFREEWAETITEARETGLFASMDDLKTRASLPARAMDVLAAADSLGSLELSRRQGLWAARGLPRARPAPLFVAAGLEEADGAPPLALPVAGLPEEVVQDYQTLRLSLKAHPVQFLRDRLAADGAIPARQVPDIPDGRRIRFGGVVLVRQRPGSSKGVVFMTLEDETGIVNVVVWPKVFDAFRPVVMGARMLLIEGRLQRAVDAEGGVVHLVAETLIDRTADLALLSEGEPPIKPPMGDDAARSGGDPRMHRDPHRHPRDVRILPPSRDFH